eukprot:2549103-Rhodomonas_salina.1
METNRPTWDRAGTLLKLVFVFLVDQQMVEAAASKGGAATFTPRQHTRLARLGGECQKPELIPGCPMHFGLIQPPTRDPRNS